MSEGAPVGKHVKRARYFEHLAGLIAEVPGTIVECGVGLGKSMLRFTESTEGSIPPRRIWGFDSFAGLPEPASQDLARPKPLRAGKLAHSQEEVISYLERHGLSRTVIDERIVLVPGYFPDSFPAYTGGPIALLHLDVDLYQSYKDCLAFFEPLVTGGGVIAFDEYRHRLWPGATIGIEEYFGGPPPGVQQSPLSKRWYLVKSSG